MSDPKIHLEGAAIRCDQAIVALTLKPLSAVTSADVRNALQILAEARDTLRWAARQTKPGPTTGQIEQARLEADIDD